jgi:ABC-type antimicrobial peptide transport system permease subunit
MTAIGAGVGLLGALAIVRAARAQLFGLEGHDPAVLGAATMLLVAVAFAAGFGPARRASRIEPMTALRHE